MLNFQSMCIMADLGDEATVAGTNEKLLCVLRAHHDGSFDMTPGFSAPAQRYRFEDDHGASGRPGPASIGQQPAVGQRASTLRQLEAEPATSARRSTTDYCQLDVF